MRSRGGSAAVVGVLMTSGVLLQGCATKLSQPASAPQPTKVRFSEFKAVEMKPIVISPAFAKAAANQKAARKIQEGLSSGMKQVFPNLVEATDAAASDKTLLIEPVVKEIKFVGGFGRFMVGAMAGSSAVLMQTTFKDKGTGEVVADPEFYRKAGAMGGGYSMGASDNMMLEEIARDICNYANLNK